MPPLVALALTGAGLWVGYKWLSREAGRVRDHLRDVEAARRRQAEAGGDDTSDLAPGGSIDAKTLPRLERDPDTGVYRPKS